MTIKTKILRGRDPLLGRDLLLGRRNLCYSTFIDSCEWFAKLCIILLCGSPTSNVENHCQTGLNPVNDILKIKYIQSCYNRSKLYFFQCLLRFINLVFIWSSPKKKS